jgi:pimeloyl-ACP methyl ester carboxylesterase
VRLIHGTDDDPVPVELSRRFTARHPWARLTELPGTGHFEFLDPATEAWAAVLAVLERPAT